MSEGQAIALQYPKSALPAVQLAIMEVVVTAVLAMWLILVFLAAREPRGKAGAVDREHRDKETAATVTGPTSGSGPGGRAAADMTPLDRTCPQGPVVVTSYQSRCAYAKDTMKLTVYGDFNCPYSNLASQRADQLIRGGMAQVDWRAVEHDRRLARIHFPEVNYLAVTVTQDRPPPAARTLRTQLMSSPSIGTRHRSPW